MSVPTTREWQSALSVLLSLPGLVAVCIILVGAIGSAMNLCGEEIARIDSEIRTWATLAWGH